MGDEPTTPLIEPDEDYDDIDKVRDDLQSTKQLLEIELKNRAKIDEEKMKLNAEIRRLKEELMSAKAAAPAPAPFQMPAVTPSVKFSQVATPVTPATPASQSYSSAVKKSASKAAISAKNSRDSDDSDEDFGDFEAVEEEMNALRGQVELARKTAEDFEYKYKDTCQKLVTTQAEMEDMEQKCAVLQKKLRKAMQNSGRDEDAGDVCNVAVQTDLEWPPPAPPDTGSSSRPMRSMSKRDLRQQMSRQDSRGSNLSSVEASAGQEEAEESDEAEEINDEDAELKAQKRELALLKSKLRSIKDKEGNARNEKVALKQQMKKFRLDLKEERKK